MSRVMKKTGYSEGQRTSPEGTSGFSLLPSQQKGKRTNKTLRTLRLERAQRVGGEIISSWSESI
jgi:hypothetical protein